MLYLVVTVRCFVQPLLIFRIIVVYYHGFVEPFLLYTESFADCLKFGATINPANAVWIIAVAPLTSQIPMT